MSLLIRLRDKTGTIFFMLSAVRSWMFLISSSPISLPSYWLVSLISSARITAHMKLTGRISVPLMMAMLG